VVDGVETERLTRRRQRLFAALGDVALPGSACSSPPWLGSRKLAREPNCVVSPETPPLASVNAHNANNPLQEKHKPNSNKPNLALENFQPK
jgi:hypothetical protein